MDHCRDLLRLVDKALRPFTRFTIEIPIECRTEHQALGTRQSKTMDIGNEDDQAGKLLLMRDSELCGLLYRVDEITPSIGECDHVRF